MVFTELSFSCLHMNSIQRALRIIEKCRNSTCLILKRPANFLLQEEKSFKYEKDFLVLKKISIEKVKYKMEY